VAWLLDQHPELVEVLARYHPHFKHLKNKLLRRVMAPRVALAQAARIAGVSADDLVATLRRAAGEGEARTTTADPSRSPQRNGAPDAPSPFEGEGQGEGRSKPAALSEVPESRQVRLDVREDIRRGHEPFARIMAAVKGLGPDLVFVLRAPFEPIPLYDVLGKRGLAHWTERNAADDWSVWFYRETGQAVARRDQGGRAVPPGHLTRVIDVRGLEPPAPMVRVLGMLDRLAPGQRLEVRHDRRPVFLYPQLDERGFAHETDEPEPGLVRIVIRRREETTG